jgi:hypothetical protein
MGRTLVANRSLAGSACGKRRCARPLNSVVSRHARRLVRFFGTRHSAAVQRGTRMAAKDKELEAIGAIIRLLDPLNDGERSRVLEYVLKRLEMATVSAPTRASSQPAEGSGATSRPVNDIRSLTAEKQPRSANEMVALIAYYLSELAAPDERVETVNVDIIRRYFKMAGFPLPSVLRNVLPNVAAAGYLENVSRGEYRLNPVGYNLVVHGLPRSGSPGPATQSKKVRKVTRKR